MIIYSEHKRARFDYTLSKSFEAGIILSGQEAKSVRQGRMDLSGAQAIFKQGELWLLNTTIPAYQPLNVSKEYKPDRNRKLLLHKEEMLKLTIALKEKGLFLIPIRVYDRKGIIKIEIALAKKKSKADERELLKKRVVQREIRQSR